MSERDAARRGGDLLLSGWKMLATCCPVCHMALFSKGDEMRCTRCDLPVRLQASDHLGNQEETDANNEVESESMLDEKDVDEPTVSYEQMKLDYAARRKQSDLVSGKIGEKLLQGWAMLVDTCPNVQCACAPLMRSDASQPMQCPVCSTQYSHSADGQLISAACSTQNVRAKRAAPLQTSLTADWPVDLSQAPTLPAADLQDEQPPAAFHSKHKSGNCDDVSTKISKYLLQGWAMLSTICACGNNAPLLRNLEGKVYCVDCGLLDDIKPIVRDDDVLDDEDEEEAEAREVAAKVSQLTSKVLSQPPVQRSSVRAVVPASKPTSGDVVETISLLEQRMTAAAQVISSDGDVAAALQQVKLVEQIALALLALENLRAARFVK